MLYSVDMAAWRNAWHMIFELLSQFWFAALFLLSNNEIPSSVPLLGNLALDNLTNDFLA